jgi:hypothetical protein
MAAMTYICKSYHLQAVVTAQSVAQAKFLCLRLHGFHPESVEVSTKLKDNQWHIQQSLWQSTRNSKN